MSSVNVKQIAIETKSESGRRIMMVSGLLGALNSQEQQAVIGTTIENTSNHSDAMNIASQAVISVLAEVFQDMRTKQREHNLSTDVINTMKDVVLEGFAAMLHGIKDEAKALDITGELPTGLSSLVAIACIKTLDMEAMANAA
jgi:hypothetical protein